MMETERPGLARRGLERGCRFIITLNLVDNMRIDLVFNGFDCHPQRVFDRERRARPVGNDANAIRPKQGTDAILLVICLIFDREERFISQKSTRFSYLCLCYFFFELYIVSNSDCIVS